MEIQRVVSERWTAIEELQATHCGRPGRCRALAINAGVDLDMVSKSFSRTAEPRAERR